MSDINNTIPVITIKAGTAVRIELEGTEGAFEIHYDTSEHSGQLVVKETEGLPDSFFGRFGMLYCTEFSMLQDEDDDCDSTGTVRHNGDEDDAGESEDTFAIYWYGAKAWFNKEKQAWTSERAEGCEYADPSLAHAQSYELLQQHGTSEQFKIIRSDSKP